MSKIDTTTKAFREGVAVATSKSTIRWEPTGHLSVKLLDTSGTKPINGCSVTVDIPKEGNVSLETDTDGVIFHPDVPFQDYELDLGDLGKVKVPAVAARNEQHRCPVPAAKRGWIDLAIVDDQGLPILDGIVTVAGETFDLRHAKEQGRARRVEPLVDNQRKTTVTVRETQVEVQLPVLPVATVVRLPKKSAT